MATATAAAMKPTLFVLKSNLKWTPFLRSPNAFKPLFDSRIMKPLKISSCKSYGFTLKCLFANNSSNSTVSKKKLPAEKIQESPLEKLANIILKALKVLQTPAVAAVVVGLLLMYDPNSALAASGGRVGGQSFSSRSSCSSSSRSYSVPRTSAGSFSYSAPYYGSSPFRSGGKIRPVTRARERGEEGVTEGLTRIETELRELKEDLEDLDKHYNSTGPAVGVIFFLFVFTLVFTSVYGFLSYRSEGGVLTATEKTSVLKLQGLV